MANRNITEAFRSLMPSLQPASLIRQQKASVLAINSDGSINPRAANEATAWIRGDWYLSGATTAGTNQERELYMPQGVRARLLVVVAKTAPVSQNLVISVTTASGQEVGVVSVTKGSAVGVSQLNYPIPAGERLRVNTVQTGGSNVTVSLFYALDPGGI